MKAFFIRIDTLFLRLFVLMWVALVVSHVVAFWTVTQGRNPGRSAVAAPHDTAPAARLPPAQHAPPRGLPVFPSLPPGNPLGQPERRPHGPVVAHPHALPDVPPHVPSPHAPSVGADARNDPLLHTTAQASQHSHGLPAADLWLDYGIRLLIIAVAAWGGARWLSRPMHRLSGAAVALSQALARGQPAPSLDEGRGTAEVREAAQVFNQMARQLQQQFDARGLHMAAVSHDLRTPLTRLRMRLTRWPDATERQAAEADIHEMDELIGDTLAVLREQNDGSQARPIAVAAFIQALSDDLADQGVHVACTLPPVDVRVQAHPVALRRILGNLVGNALRHGGNAHVWATAVGQRVHMGVDDQGPGIPEAQLAQAFEPWMRLSDQGGADVPSPLMPNPSRTGHGLGLAIARDLAQRDGGEVTLNNRAEGGLRAVLNLPLYPLLPDSI